MVDRNTVNQPKIDNDVTQIGAFILLQLNNLALQHKVMKMSQHVELSPKTLRQYRKEQESKRASEQGSDFEDWMILQCAECIPPEQSLWRAVLLQMITDAISNSAKPDQKRFRRDARHWLTRHSRDFRLVCEFAGYQPDWLQQEINRFLARHNELEQQNKNHHQASVSYGFSVRYTLQDATITASHTPKAIEVYDHA